MKLQHLCFTVVLLSIAISCCRGQGGGAGGGAGGAVVPGTQDAIQIVAQAALCFDNRQVINGCLKSLGFNVSGNGGTSRASSPALAPAPGPSAAGTGTKNGSAVNIFCQRPCFGQITLMMTCVNGILSNIQGYNPGLMQGVQALFQMACGNVTNGTSSSAVVASGIRVLRLSSFYYQ
ncbi:hypothetical protein PR202_ga04395 [Eleusine coracana subsp. coracana]|uniref:DUF7731 domain-containing protein n=1 Tax=Eleusine coracana subsp. coracana TaxID=191504 RepID=A0AAV5BR27_ELECO|nr:hypothetical protein PR202_ga04395 [Eleusine coracana subsp. coracana]